jgi:hypothetical protein
MITGFVPFWDESVADESFAATIMVPPTWAAPTAHTVLDPNWLSATVVHVIEGPSSRTADPSLPMATGCDERLGLGVLLEVERLAVDVACPGWG